jgi:hypothetical protein
MGFAAMTWFERGERPSQEALQAITAEVGAYLRAQIGELRGQPGDRGAVTTRIRHALEGLPAHLGRRTDRDETAPFD